MRHLSIDIETYSSVDIKKAGLYKYEQSPDFEILMMAYAWEDGVPRILDFYMKGEADSPEAAILRAALADPDVVKHAYNAPFEWYCLNRAGFAAPLEQWRCTMFHGLYCGYPAGLASVGEALGLPSDKKKLGTGGSLIRTFCIPCKPTRNNGIRTRTLPHHEPERWELFKQYCMQDVVTEMAVEARLAAWPVPDTEQELWVLDQQINARGVAVDRQLVQGAMTCGATVAEQLTAEAIGLTGLNNPKSTQQLKKWLDAEMDEEVEDLQKETVSALIKNANDKTVRRVLEIRQELSKTSTKKYDAIATAVCDDGRVRGLFQIYGANRTGRWGGRIVQPQNLPRNYLSTLDFARRMTAAGRLDVLRLIYGNVPDTLSQLIRTAFVPSEGRRLIVADFSAIEARVIAWWAGEAWRQEVFATHGKIYEASASAMFGVPIEHIVKDREEYALRQKGKVAELALGYQGGPGALMKMGALKQGLTEEELPEIVQRWRSANRRIVDLWYAMERAAIEVVKTARPTSVNGVSIAREADAHNDFLTIRLPSGRKLYYSRPTLQMNDLGRDALHYWGVDQTTKKWTRMSTYGGRLVENCTQAIARDCLAVALSRLDAAGYETVMHVHDEAVIDALPGQTLDGALGIMRQPISWADGLILNADGFECGYYMKN